MKKHLVIFGFVGALMLASAPSCGNNETPPTDNNEDNNDENKQFDGELAKGPSLPEGEQGVAIRYLNTSHKYEDRALRIWENNGGEGAVYTFSEVDDFGAVCFLPLSTWSSNVLTNGIGIIMRPLADWSGQSDDLMVTFSDFNVDEQGYYNIFLKQGANSVFDNPDLKFKDAIIKSQFTGQKRITVETTSKIESYTLYKNDEVLDSKNNIAVTTISYEFKDGVDISAYYSIKVKFKETGKEITSDINKMILYGTKAFNEKYYYNGELGAIYTKEITIFKVWSPFSSNIKLRIYQSGTPTHINQVLGNDTFEEYEMKLGEKGVFTYEVSGDLEGKYYTYIVTNNKYKNKEVVDPYAKSTGINGLRGMIVDFSKTNPTGWDKLTPNAYSRTELVIYETHVSDITSSSTWGGSENNAKKFTGLIEKNTKYTNNDETVSTGFDHIKELGINAIQLIPIFDQANDELLTSDSAFNWGYNPLNYNSLDGIYSKNPYDGYEKIKEFKNVVKEYTSSGINVIMDVVYNHVNSSKGSNFDVLMPDYYFRYTSDGKYSNGSGCGNEVASEKSMVRKFILDSTEFWAKEYKLGGLRFDLMGLTDMETMNQVAKNIKEKVNPNIFIHGEPWTGGTTTLAGNYQAQQSNINKFEGYGAFNDQIRDALIRGGLSAETEKGWITNTDESSLNDYSTIVSSIKGFTGTFSTDPLKATNYVTCHDNFTLYDRFEAAGIPLDTSTYEKMSTLANAIILTSQGTSFILAGEEFLRSKGGDNNSYNSGYKVNELNYSNKIEHEKLFNNYKSLINIKKTNKAFQYETAEKIKQNITFSENKYNNSVIDYEITEVGNTFKVIHSNLNAAPYILNLSGSEIILDTSDKVKVDMTNYEVTPGSTIIIKK